MEESLKKYKSYLKDQELSESTIASYLRYVRRFLNYLQGRPIEKQITLQFRDDFESRQKKLSTVNLATVAVNRYLQYLGKEGCMIKTKKYQHRRSLEHVITVEEYHKLLAYARENGQEKYYAIMKTLALTGIRISELSSITVQALEQGYTVVQNKGKTREIYFSDSLVDLLKEYCLKQGITQDVIFRGNRGKELCREAVWKQLKILAERAGVTKEKVYPHSFRHFFALNYMKHFSNIFELADILGHSSLETTRIYLADSIEQRRKKMEELDI